MMYRFNNFTFITDKRIESIGGTVAAPVQISRTGSKVEKYELQEKSRSFNVFMMLGYDGEKVIDNDFELIDLIEILKGFTGNKLDVDRTYKFQNFKGGTAQKNGKISLKIDFKNYDKPLFFDKFEAAAIAAKFQKIYSKCEAWGV